MLYPEKPRFRTSALREYEAANREAHPTPPLTPNPSCVMESPNNTMEGRMRKAAAGGAAATTMVEAFVPKRRK